MNKTKENLFRELWIEHNKKISDEELHLYLDIDEMELIGTAMSEYAKQDAIEFLKWVKDKRNQMQITNIYLTEFDDCYNKIYELYLQYKTKQDV